MRNNKSKATSGAIVLLTAGVIALTAGSASAADSRNFGAASCQQGGLYTRAVATQAPRHYLFQGGQITEKTFPNSGGAYVQRTFYSGLYAATASGVQTPGNIQSGHVGCSD